MNTLDKLLFNLQTIANIPKGGRLNTTKEFIGLEEETLLQGFWRRYNADSRDKAVAAICREVRTVIMIANYVVESVHIVGDNDQSDMRNRRYIEIKKIGFCLTGASRGISNICQTYSADSDVIGNLAPLIEEINECLSTLNIAT